MKLIVETMMVFFGTLLAAGLVALGEPASAEIAIVNAAKPAAAQAQQREAHAQQRSRGTAWTAQAATGSMR